MGCCRYSSRTPRPRANFFNTKWGGPPRLAIFFNRAVDLKHQIAQRLIGAKHVAVPQEPFYTLQFLENAFPGRLAACRATIRLRPFRAGAPYAARRRPHRV